MIDSAEQAKNMEARISINISLFKFKNKNPFSEKYRNPQKDNPQLPEKGHCNPYFKPDKLNLQND